MPSREQKDGDDDFHDVFGDLFEDTPPNEIEPRDATSVARKVLRLVAIIAAALAIFLAINGVRR